MQIEIAIKNYRCYSDARPLKVSIRPGFTSFVGANNAGKSTILKSFYELRAIFHLLANKSHDVAAMAVVAQTRGLDLSPGLFDRDELFHDGNDRDIELDITFPQTLGKSAPQITRALVSLDRTLSWRIQLFSQASALTFQGDHHFRANELCSSTHRSVSADFTAFFEAFKTLNQIMFVGAFRHVIPSKSPTHSSGEVFQGGNNYFDLIIGQDFVEAFSSYQTGSRSQSRAIGSLIADLSEVFALDNLKIVAAPSRQTFQIGIGNSSYKLSELGSGFTQFLVVLGNALIKRPSYIFIDEPELHLHPTLQQKFLLLLGKYSAQGVYYATHSYGLARSSADEVYTVRHADGQRLLQPLAQTSLVEFLGELSFSGYQELGFKKILLVEGPTDVRSTQEFLRKLRKDHEVVVIHLGGASSINGNCAAQLQELKRITKELFCLVDSERTAAGEPPKPNVTAFEAVCKKLKIKCKVLDRRATENYFCDRAVKEVKGPSCSALHEYQPLGSVAPQPWGKNENWKFAAAMTKQELLATDLGQFLSKV